MVTKKTTDENALIYSGDVRSERGDLGSWRGVWIKIKIKIKIVRGVSDAGRI